MEGYCEFVKNAVLNKNVLSANQDLDPGNVVLQLPAIVAGPGRGKLPVCVGCLHLFDKDVVLSPCTSCSWPVCSVECENDETHKKECDLLKSSGVKCQIINFIEVTTALDFLTPLRLVTKLASDKKMKEKCNKIQGQYSDLKERNVEEYGPNSDSEIITFINKTIKSSYGIEEIQRAIMIIEKYAMPLDCGALGIYEDLPNISHSCSPNTYFNSKSSKEIVYRATKDIKNGETITYCKTDMTKCNLFRKRLLTKLCISCECDRCKDGTEYGTGFGSLQCQSCEGFILSADPRNIDAEWICGGCNKKTNGRECIDLLDALNVKLIKLSESADDNKETATSFDQLLSRRDGEWKNLPSNSQLFLDMRYRLIFIYQYHRDFYHNRDDFLKAKMNHCYEWLNLAGKLFPGRSYARVFIEFELVNAAVGLMNWMRQNFLPTDEVNLFIAQILKMGVEPVIMLVEEEDQSMNKALKQLLQVAVEAREVQKKRILINQWADDDEEWYK